MFDCRPLAPFQILKYCPLRASSVEKTSACYRALRAQSPDKVRNAPKAWVFTPSALSAKHASQELADNQPTSGKNKRIVVIFQSILVDQRAATGGEKMA